jgi:hypothetical protein
MILLLEVLVFWLMSNFQGRYSQDPLFLLRNVYKTESFRCQNSDTRLYAVEKDGAFDH